MSRGNFEVCTCGHRYPEHSLFGTCYGCLDCPDVEMRPADHEEFGDHPHRQCSCSKFVEVDDPVYSPTDAVTPLGMERTNDASPTPKDATEATDEQREWQDELDHQGEDPDAPGLQQDRHQIADET